MGIFTFLRRLKCASLILFCSDIIAVILFLFVEYNITTYVCEGGALLKLMEEFLGKIIDLRKYRLIIGRVFYINSIDKIKG